MKTRITKSAKTAARFVRSGGVVAFPTETVYGLGADIFNESAIGKIFEAKMRPSDNPLIAHISELAQIKALAAEVSDEANALIDSFFPGPLTIVLKKATAVPLIATAGLDTIGVRMPRHPLAHEFLLQCGTPVVAPSANLSGRPSPTTIQAVIEDLDGRIDCILKGENAEIGIESTVVDCSEGIPVILRSGSVSAERLRDVIPGIPVMDPQDFRSKRSPGLRHRHYSPAAKVKVIDDIVMLPANAAFIGMSHPNIDTEYSRVCRDVAEYAHELFEFFRECDRRGIKVIYCERVNRQGAGHALMDRIERAAA